MELRTHPGRRRRRGPSCLMVLIGLLLLGLGYFLALNREQIVEAVVPPPTATPTQSPANVALRAQLYERDGEYENAITAYEEVIRLSPEKVENYIQLVNLLVQTGQPERALVIAETGLELASDDDRLYEVQAAAYLKNGERLEANREDPSTAYARAVEAGRAAVRLNNVNARAHAYIAAGLIRENSELVLQAFDSAETALRIMETDLRENRLKIADKVILYHYAEVQIVSGNYQTAQERLVQAYDIDKNYLDARLELARIYFFFLKQNAGAIDLLETALEDNPNNATLLDTLAYFQIVSGNYAEGERYARQAVEADSDMVRAHARLGWAYFKNSNYPDAIEELRIATAGYQEPTADTSFFFALLGLALYFEDTAFCAEAVPILQAALAVSTPNSPGEINAEIGLENCREVELNQG